MTAGVSLLFRELRLFVLSLGKVMMPEAYGMPGFDQESLGRFEEQIQSLGDAGGSILSLLRMLRLRAGIITASMNPRRERRLARLLDKMSQGSFPDRQILRSLGLLMKMSHYESEKAHRAAGTEFIRTHIRANEHDKLNGIIGLDELEDLSELTVDAIVVGSGAGGAVMAYELAAAGWTVLIIEEGDYHGRKTFNRSTSQASRKLYQNSGLSFTLGIPSIYLPTGRSVGGTTTINSGTCYRPPGRVHAKWQKMGLEGWGEKELTPHFEKVEKILQVQRAESKYLGGVADVISEGCEHLGYEHRPLSRNAPGCDGQGICAFGCPTNAKSSTNVSYIPLALKNGAYLSPGTRLEQVLLKGDEVEGALVKHLKSGRYIKLSCKRLFLSTGSLRTPLLLKKLGVRNRHLGRNLSIHPAAAAIAEFDRPICGDRAIPQGYAIEAFHEQGMLYEGASIPLELMASSLFLHGDKLQRVLSDFNNLAIFGFLVEDQGVGRVLGEKNGFPLVHYPLAKADLKKLHKGLEILAGVYLAAGAKSVRPLLQEDVEIRNWDDLRVFASRPLRASTLELSAYHPLGTARTGVSASEGVVDPSGQVFGLCGLYVADGSMLPTSPAVNPQITIMATATHLASMLIEQER